MKKLSDLYKTEIIPAMKKKFKLSNVFEVPRITKVSISAGLSKNKENPKFAEIVRHDLYLITGQKPTKTHAKKAVSGFKVRQGDIVGVRVTLRKKKMYDFLEKLIRIVLPRTRDFRGISSKSVDKQGNYTLALREQIVFTEIEYDKVEEIYGMQVSITFSSNNEEQNKELIKLLGFPFNEHIGLPIPTSNTTKQKKKRQISR